MLRYYDLPFFDFIFDALLSIKFLFETPKLGLKLGLIPASLSLKAFPIINSASSS